MRSEINRITSGKGGEIYAALLDSITFRGQPHEFVGRAYRYYSHNYPSNPSINGRIFEYLVCETLARAGVVPFYYQAQFNYITLSEGEAAGVTRKMNDGDIAGLTACVVADSPAYSCLIETLKKRTFCIAKPIIPIHGLSFPA